MTTTKRDITLKELILNIKGWIRYLMSKWYIIIASVLVGAIVGYFYIKSKKPIYIATTTFVLESGSKTGGLGQYAGMAAMVGIDLGGKGDAGIFEGDNLQELYKSRKMIEATLLMCSKSDSTILLLDRYLALSQSKERWKEKNPELLQICFNGKNDNELQRAKDSILNQATVDINKNNLTIGKLDAKLSIIKVDVKSENEVFSKEFNESLVAQVNEFYVRTKTKKSLENVSILQRKTDSVRAVMNGNIDVAAFTIDATPNLNPTRQAQRLVPTQRSQVSAETNKAILAELVKNLEMSKMGLLQESPLIQKVDEPIYPLEKKAMGNLKGALLGGFVAGFLMIFFILIRKLFKSIMSQ